MKKKISGILALIMFLSVFINTFSIKAEAAENYVTAIREVNPSVITPDGEAEVKIKVTGTPPVNVVKPNDVILVLDKSTSMQDDNKFNAMQESAKEFIDLIDFNSHNAGVVDFSTSARSLPLTNDTTVLKNHIDSIKCEGNTMTGLAIREAMKLLENGREKAQPVIVLLTDGQATDKADALKAAEEAKEAGIVFYTIALLAPGEDADASAPNELLKNMATTRNHHHFVLGSVGLIDIYRDIVKEIGIASAYDVKITEEVSPQFEIVPGSYDNNIPKPQVVGNTLTWNILELKADTLELNYKIRPKSDTVVGKYNVASKSVITYKNHEGNEQTYNVPNKVLEIKNYPPVITSVTNDSSHVNGGEKIIIKGSNFSKGARVKINNSGCTNVVFVDSNTIEAVTPQGVKGDTTLTVINDDNQKATADFSYYGYRDMTITKIRPNSGSLDGGEFVYIEGTNFVEGDESSVEIGGNKARIIYIFDSNIIKVVAPANATPGKYDVVVTNGGGQKLTIKEGYEYLAPPPVLPLAVTAISGTSGYEEGGNSIYITGDGFLKESIVTIGGNVAPIDQISSTKVRAKVPKGIPGDVDVIVTNPNGESVTAPMKYTYIERVAEITSLSRTEGYLEGRELVYITGKDFIKDIEVYFGDNKAELLNYYDTGKIRVRVPAAAVAGDVDVKIINGNGKSVTKANAYKYVTKPPKYMTITEIKPNSGSTKGGELVYILGTNFVKGDDLSVEIGGNKVELLNYYDTGTIRVRIPANSTPGKYDVVVTNGDGQKVTVVDGYEYLAPPPPPAPTISQITPNAGSLKGGELVYITGANFLNGDNLSVEIGGNKVELLNYYDTGKIRVRIPANSTPGKYDVVVTNGDGQKVTVKDGYEYLAPPPPPAPTISEIRANVGTTKGGELVYIYGANFLNGEKLSVEIGGNKAELLNYFDTGTIRVRIPANSTPGKYDVVVTNGDGQKVTVKEGYEYIAP